MADDGTSDVDMPFLCDDEMCDHKTERQADKQSDQPSEVHAKQTSVTAQSKKHGPKQSMTKQRLKNSRMNKNATRR